MIFKSFYSETLNHVMAKSRGDICTIYIQIVIFMCGYIFL